MGLGPLTCWHYGFESRLGYEFLSLLSAVRCQVEGSAMGLSLVERGPTDCGVSEYDVEVWTMRRSRPTRTAEPRGEKMHHTYSYWSQQRISVRPAGKEQNPCRTWRSQRHWNKGEKGFTPIFQPQQKRKSLCHDCIVLCFIPVSWCSVLMERNSKWASSGIYGVREWSFLS